MYCIRVFLLVVASSFVIGLYAEESNNLDKKVSWVSVNYLDEVVIEIPAKVVIEQGNKNLYRVAGKQKAKERLKISSRGGKLLFKEKFSFSKSTATKDDLVIYLKVSELLRFHSKGNSELQLIKIAGRKLTISSEGNFHLQADVNLDEFNVYLKGSASAVLEGVARYQEIDLDGSMDYRAKALQSEEIEILAKGKGEISLFATKRLSATLEGDMLCYYLGKPKKIEKNIQGISVLRSISP